jgi:hypothetical protein
MKHTRKILFCFLIVVLISGCTSDHNQSISSDTRLLADFVTKAHSLSRDSKKYVTLRIGDKRSTGHASILSDGVLVAEINSSGCLFAPLNFEIVFDGNSGGRPVLTEPLYLIVTNGSERYVNVMPDGSVKIKTVSEL